MTDEQINIKIAKLCGWTEIEPCTCCKWQSRGFRPEGSQHKKHLPNYTADLNACHEFEKAMTDEDHACFRKQLGEVVGDVPYFCRKFTSATARQRCEAFLRVHGQWEEQP